MLKKNIKWSKELILTRIKELSEENIRLVPSVILGLDARLFNAAIQPKYFGSWKNALSAAGINPDDEYARFRREHIPESRWTPDAVLQRMSKINDNDLAHIYKTELSLYSAARREFGSWEKALRAAGRYVDDTQQRKEALIAEIQQAYKEDKLEAVSKKRRLLYMRAYRTFGNWRKALQAAGISDRDS